MTDHTPPAPFTVLAFDTSTACMAAAVCRGGTVLASVQSLAERNHSVLIVPEIRRLLEESGIAPDQLDAIAVGRGPGSYTGVRIAVSVGKTLAWTWHKTLLGVSSLEALALGAWEARSVSVSGTVWIVPVMDARRGQVYTARFAANEEGRWERLDPDGIRMAGDWADALRKEAAAAGAAGIWFTGETGPHESLYAGGEEEGAVVRTIPRNMDAGAAAKLAEARFRRGEGDDIHSFVPNYTQLTEAEVKLQAAARRE